MRGLVSTRLASAAASAALLATGCTDEADARPQWVVTLSTDAIGPYWGDRVLVEVLTASGGDACAGALSPVEASASLACRRVLPAPTPAAWPLSFGIGAPATGSEPLRVRAILYRNAYVDDAGLPARPARIEVTAELPPPTGVTSVLLELPMSCFGVEADVGGRQTCVRGATTLVAEPVLPPDPDLESALVAGSWPPGQSVPCDGEPPPGMVCIPGGAFLLGSFEGLAAVADGLEIEPEIPVQISPFFLDVAEFTAGDASEVAPEIGVNPIPWDPDPQTDHYACNQTPDGSKNHLPSNCVSKAFARQACVEKGKQLPSEAQWEYVASGAGAENFFSWGFADSIEDVCARSIVGRGRTDITSNAQNEDSGCRSFDGEVVPWGPTTEGDAEDVTPQGVRNMSGNMAEWVEGLGTDYSSGCWQGAIPLLDPVCTTGNPSSGQLRIVRGAGWSDPPYFAQVAVRRLVDDAAPSVGFRCAK